MCFWYAVWSSYNTCWVLFSVVMLVVDEGCLVVGLTREQPPGTSGCSLLSPTHARMAIYCCCMDALLESCMVDGWVHRQRQLIF